MNLKSYYDRAALFVAAIVFSTNIFAQGFSAGISPSKFELRAKPGAVLRDTITLVNASPEPADYKFSTVDWEMNDSQGPDFFENQLIRRANRCRQLSVQLIVESS